MPDMYLNVYDSSRPGVFFKTTPNWVVGLNDGVGIRSDSEWNVPESEPLLCCIKAISLTTDR